MNLFVQVVCAALAKPADVIKAAYAPFTFVLQRARPFEHQAPMRVAFSLPHDVVDGDTMLKFCVALKIAGENVCPFVGVFHVKHLNKLSINIKISVGISKNFVGAGGR